MTEFGGTEPRSTEIKPDRRDTSRPTASEGDIQLLTNKQAAVFIGRAPGWLDKARCNGNGPPFYRIGRRILYDRADLVAWLRAHRYDSTSAY